MTAEQAERISLPELECLALEATPGPWKWDCALESAEQYRLTAPTADWREREVLGVSEGTVYSEYSSDSATIDVSPQNAAYIAAMSPDACLALIEEVKDARDQSLVAPSQRWRGECGHEWRKDQSDECPICQCLTLIERVKAAEGAVIAMREQAAMVADNWMALYPSHFGDDWGSGSACAARDIAAAIRALPTNEAPDDQAR